MTLPSLYDRAMEVRCPAPGCGALPDEPCVATQWDAQAQEWRTLVPLRQLRAPHEERVNACMERERKR